jgi:hypothetical protein
MKKILVTLVCLSTVGAFAEDFSISTSSNTAFGIDASTKSCQAMNLGSSADDVSPVYFMIPAINFQWTRAETLTLHWVKFELRSNDFSQVRHAYTMAGDQLMFTIYGNDYTPSSNLTSVTLPNTVADTQIGDNLWANTCAFKIPGVGVADKSRDAQGELRITAYGTYFNSHGQEVSVTAEKTISFLYMGN